MTTALILNTSLSIVVFAVVVGLIAWSIAADRRATAVGLVRAARRPQVALAARKLRGVPLSVDS